MAPSEKTIIARVRRVPQGYVTTYGDLSPGSPRHAGRVLSQAPEGVPWWRVVRSDGGFLPGHEREALANYREEGTPLKPDGGRIDMARARWSPGDDGIPGSGSMDDVPADFAGE